MFRFFVAVQFTDIKRIHAHFCCKHIHGNFGTHKGLWRTITTECRAPCMVGKYRLALIANGRNMITSPNELAETMRQEITKFGVWTVVNVVVAPQAKQLPIFICCQFNVHESRGTFASVSDVLIHIEYQGYWTLAYQCSNPQNGFVGW